MTEFRKLTPFKRCVLQNFPFIEEDFDAITNYQLLCKVVEYLNDVINSQNEVITKTEELTIAFNNLKNHVDTFFDTLDLQEEVNNKLDEMAESGQLADIIAEYIKLRGVLAYNTLSDLKSATNIVEGSICKTIGNTAYNDNKGSIYKIRTVTSSDVVDEINIVSLSISNTLIAEKIGEYGNNPSDPIFYGADPTGTIDSSEYINKCIQANKGGSISFSAGTYLVNNTINLPYKNDEKVSINGNGAIIKTSATLDRLFFYGYDKGSNSNNDVGFPVYIKDLYIKGEDGNVTNCIETINGFKDLRILNCTIFRFVNGVKIGQSTGYSSDVLITDCLIYGKGSEYAGTGVIGNGSDNNIVMCRIYGFRIGIELNSASRIEKTHILLRWKNQTGSNFDPYERNSDIFNEYYTQTVGVKADDMCTFVNSYVDSMYKMSEINTDRACTFNSSFYYNARDNVNCRIFDIKNDHPKLIITNCTIDFSSNDEGVCIYNGSGNNFNNFSQIFIKDNTLIALGKCTNPADPILVSNTTDISNKNVIAGNWYIVGALTNVNANTAIDYDVIIDGYIYTIRLLVSADGSSMSFKQFYAGSNNSNWTIGACKEGNTWFICVKNNTNSTSKFAYKLIKSTNFVFSTPIIQKGSSIPDSSRLLTDYTDEVPANHQMKYTMNIVDL